MKAYVKTIMDRSGSAHHRWEVRMGKVVIGEYVTRHTADKIAEEINRTKIAPAVAMVRTEPRPAYSRLFYRGSK